LYLDSMEEKSKTQLIREYFLARPNKVISPTEVATDLGMDKHVTSTIVHRLENDGEIQRAGRGEYILRKEINLSAAADIYKELYQGVARNIGLRAIETMTRMKEEDFNREEPIESIKLLAVALKAWFGEEAVRNILMNLEAQSDDDNIQLLVREIKNEILKKK
jgi:DNA-binding MarR family transcriptional regulator